ncbi:hypothetical protein [Mariniblastus fucicola]|uniref:hypothetical protein n=1 Tax=Mariniblastus fucicola TaxID=980251 RepID=UPI0011DF7F8F|nr:hypothetical protein [Mariniblastus fucicola]
MPLQAVAIRKKPSTVIKPDFQPQVSQLRNFVTNRWLRPKKLPSSCRGLANARWSGKKFQGHGAGRARKILSVISHRKDVRLNQDDSGIGKKRHTFAKTNRFGKSASDAPVLGGLFFAPKIKSFNCFFDFFNRFGTNIVSFEHQCGTVQVKLYTR